MPKSVLNQQSDLSRIEVWRLLKGTRQPSPKTQTSLTRVAADYCRAELSEDIPDGP
jgi:hypothetical protein